MTPVEVLMPRMGLTMDEGTIVAWYKQEGAQVEKGEPLLQIQTDKAVVDVESPETGTLARILHEQGETVPVGESIALIVCDLDGAVQ